jgi:hypothetical protein
MLQQTYSGKVRWVIVDDGEVEQPVNFKRDNWSIEIVRPSHRWTEGANTQQKNLLAGLQRINNTENLVIIEDDDYYSDIYLETINEWLSDCELVGESEARYYNKKTKKYRQLANYFHSSLCSTAMKGRAIEFFRAVCMTHDNLIDLNLWKKYKGQKRLYKTKMVVGIKGMEGRAGIGAGHKKDFQGKIDEDGSVFADWLKGDVTLYE